jgi:hypothetical protein
MSEIFIIGLPVSFRRRLEAAAGQRNLQISSVLADLAERGSLRLLPYPGQAILDLTTYLNTLEDRCEANVLVLPYAKLPLDLDNELDTLEDNFNETVIRVQQGSDGWPKLEKLRPDQNFLDSLFFKLTAFLFPAVEFLPSAYYLSLAARNKQILITEGALQSCDEVAPHRFSFMKKVADAFDQYVADGGSGGRIDAFFERKGLKHAQTGGINAKLQIHRGGTCIYDDTSKSHLKQGDNTTRIAAARVYYQSFNIDARLYVAVLYAGPHPDADVTRSFEFD